MSFVPIGKRLRPANHFRTIHPLQYLVRSQHLFDDEGSHFEAGTVSDTESDVPSLRTHSDSST